MFGWSLQTFNKSLWWIQHGMDEDILSTLWTCLWNLINDMAKKPKTRKGQKPNQKRVSFRTKCRTHEANETVIPRDCKEWLLWKKLMKSVSKTQAHLSKKKLMKTRNCIELTWILASTLLKVVCIFLSIHFKSLFLHL